MGVIFEGMTNDEAIFWYGITALLNAVPTLVTYAAGSSNPYIEAFKVGVAMKQALWWPVALTWIWSYIDDSKFNRHLIDNATALSTLDPFAGAWIALNAALVHLYENEIDFKITTWVGLAIWGVITIWENMRNGYAS